MMCRAVSAALLWLLAATPVLAERLISLGGDVTEIVYALGAGERLVGVDVTSDYPLEATRLPQLGYLRALATEGVQSLRPDRILYSEHAGPPSVLVQLRASGIPLHPLSVEPSVEALRGKIRQLGVLLQREADAETLLAEIDRQAAALATGHPPRPPRVLFLLSHAGPALAAGYDTSAHAMIELAGGANAAGFRGYKTLNPEALVRMAPELILVTDLGLAQLGGERGLWALPGMRLTPAARSGQLLVMDAQKLLGFGPRALQAALELQSRLQELSP